MKEMGLTRGSTQESFLILRTFGIHRERPRWSDSVKAFLAECLDFHEIINNFYSLLPTSVLKIKMSVTGRLNA